jgi:hypothetical protein
VIETQEVLRLQLRDEGQRSIEGLTVTDRKTVRADTYRLWSSAASTWPGMRSSRPTPSWW